MTAYYLSCVAEGSVVKDLSGPTRELNASMITTVVEKCAEGGEDLNSQVECLSDVRSTFASRKSRCARPSNAAHVTLRGPCERR